MWHDEPWPRRCQRALVDTWALAKAAANGHRRVAAKREEAIAQRDEAVRLCSLAALKNAAMEMDMQRLLREKDALEADVERIIGEKDEEVQSARRFSRREAALAWLVAIVVIGVPLLYMVFVQGNK